MRATFTIRASILGVALVITLTHAQYQHWNDPNSDQFHIQTDEGNERYFRYQTHNGQYRKEKRLEDGTIVGSFGWIDGDGMLRLQDYIADNAGYRILRTKDVFVGRNRPISQAIKEAKKAPATGGELTKTRHQYLPPVGYVASTTESPLNNDISSLGYISSTENPLRIRSSTGLPTILHSYHSSTPLPPVISSTPSPYINIASQTPYVDISSPSSTAATVVISPKAPSTIYLASTPASPTAYLSSSRPIVDYLPSSPLPTAQTLYSTPAPSYYYESSTPSSVYFNPLSTISPAAVAINENSLVDYSSEPQYEHYQSNQPTDYRFQNGPTYPITKLGASYTGNHIGNGYDPQYPQYNGVSVTNDGFRYYIPRAYHEEQSDNGGASKSGSFGYIDPFGIRRVIYYNAGADGFKHRKNNRYVGFNATPYDPRPY